jgi:SPP1 gp7 family putative phage head morphogenesis protein
MDQGEQPYRVQLQRIYAQVIANLEGDMQLLAMRIEQARDAGEEINPDWLRRQSRYTQLLMDAEREFDYFARQGEQVVQGARLQAVRGGAAEAWELMDASGITTDFAGGRINTLAVSEALAATESAPIRAILGRYGVNGAKTIEDTLLDGIARGRSPRAIIRDIKRGLGSDANTARLEALVRTESMRAYRGSLNEQYARMDHLIAGYRWSAAKSVRTCLACLGRDGEVQATPWDQMHVACRCISTPVPKGSTYKYVTGEEWLRRQDVSVQRRMMPTEEAFDAWQSGRVGLADFVGVKQDKVYGESVFQKSGRQVLEAA